MAHPLNQPALNAKTKIILAILKAGYSVYTFVELEDNTLNVTTRLFPTAAAPNKQLCVDFKISVAAAQAMLHVDAIAAAEADQLVKLARQLNLL